MSDIKVLRYFFGNYQANPDRLRERGYHIMKPLRLMSVASKPEHGAGRIQGITQKKGVIYSNVPIFIYRRDNRLFLWETKSKTDGSYAFRNIAKGLECFILAFDPNGEYNAVISDKVVPK